jgi:hypothetical protein
MRISVSTQGYFAQRDVLKLQCRQYIVERMTPMNSQSATALAWTALVVNTLGLMVLAIEAQFVFSAFAALLVLYPAIFARDKARVCAGVVLILSVSLAVAGYPQFVQSPYMQRAVTQQ